MYDIVIDEKYNKEYSYEYILSIQVSLNGFSFSIVEPTESRLLAFHKKDLKISSDALIARHFEDWLSNIELLQSPFKKIRIIILSDKFTLVPSKYSSKELTREIPGILFFENTKPELAENLVKVISSRLIFGLPAGINSVIQDKIGECEILHPVKLMINQIQNLDAEKGLILSVNSKSFYLVLFDNKTILSANSFKINHPNDIVYFLLSTLKQMQFDTKSIRLYLNETVDNGDEIVSLLKPYFNKVEYLPINNAPHISETIQPQTIYGNFLLSNF